MPKSSLLFALAIIVATLAAADYAAAQEQWRTYTNPRFGTRADYPAHIFTRLEPPPDNSDGQVFTDSSGSARLSIYGSFNSLDDTPRSFVDNYVKKDGPLAFERVATDFFAASRINGDKILYQRCNFGHGNPGIIHCFAIEYPAREKQRWDAIVTRIGASLRAGPGIER